MRRDEFTFFHELRVRWAEVDRQDIVFNGNYFLYFDVAITEYWRALGLLYPQELQALGTDFFAVKATAEFHGSATFDDQLSIGCRTGRIGRSSLQLVLGVFRGDSHLTSGELVYVNADTRDKRSVPLPDFVREKIVAFERTPPAR